MSGQYALELEPGFWWVQDEPFTEARIAMLREALEIANADD